MTGTRFDGMMTGRKDVEPVITAIYVQPMGRLCLAGVLCMLAYRGLLVYGEKKGLGKILSCLTGVLLSLWCLGGCYVTLGRDSGYRDVSLIPGYSIYLGLTGNRELFRSMFMNVLLFVPGGFFLRLLPGKGGWPKWGLGLLILGSLCIEWIQYVGYLGRAEVDDVLCNAMGAVLGVLCAKIGSKGGRHRI